MRNPIRAKSIPDAWLQAVHHLKSQDDWRDYALILEIAEPMSLSISDSLVFAAVDDFLSKNEKFPLNTVVNTIFPASLYRTEGLTNLFKSYQEMMPELRKHPDLSNWGNYFMRMISRIDHKGQAINPLECLITKLRRQVEISGTKRAIYEVDLIDPIIDIPLYDAGQDKGRLMGGPCLSHLSFKVKADKSLMLIAFYRSHYYIERALGNLLGLAFLQDCVAKEAGLKSGELICISSMAILDHDGMSKSAVESIIGACKKLQASPVTGVDQLTRN